MELDVNDNGVVKKATKIYVNENGVVKEVLTGWVNEAGTVKQFFTNFTGPTVPGEYTNFRVTSFTTNQIVMQWTLPPDGGSPLTIQRVYRSTNGTTFTLRASPAAAATSYTDIALQSSTQYWYYIFAENAIGAGPQSNTITQITESATAPGTPSFTITATGNPTITTSVTKAASGADPIAYRFQVRLSNSGDAFADAGGNNAFTGSPQTITLNAASGIQANTAYEVRVLATGTPNSAYSTTKFCVTTGATGTRTLSAAEDPLDTGAYKDTGWGLNTLYAGPVFGSLNSVAFSAYNAERIAQAGSSTFTFQVAVTGATQTYYKKLTVRNSGETTTNAPTARTLVFTNATFDGNHQSTFSKWDFNAGSVMLNGTTYTIGYSI